MSTSIGRSEPELSREVGELKRQLGKALGTGES